MNILFLTMPRNKNECSYYSEYITNYGGACVIHETQEDFFNEIRACSFKPELLVLDYTHFNHLILNVYNYLLHTYHCTIPAVFFNDPNLKEEKKVEYWSEMLDTMYGMEPLQSGRYKKALTILSNAMKEYSTICFRNGIAPAYKESACYTEKQLFSPSESGAPAVIDTDHLQEQHMLPVESSLVYCSDIASRLTSSAYLIYDTLVKEAPEAVSLQELINVIKKNEKTPSKNTVVCLISSIRTVLKNAPDKKYDIIKTHGGYKLLKR